MFDSGTVIKAAFASVGGIAVFWLGGMDQLLKMLIALIVIDYLTGVIKAICEKKLSSEIGAKGIAKKVFFLLIVAMSFVIESLTTQALPLREIVIMFYAANEGISILENAAKIGVPFPRKLMEILVQLEGKGESDE